MKVDQKYYIGKNDKITIRCLACKKKEDNCSRRSKTKTALHQGDVPLLTHLFHSSRVQAIISKKNGYRRIVQKEIGVG